MNCLKMRIDKVISSAQSLGIFDVSNENKVRFVIEDAGASNTIVVRGRITGQSSFTTLQSIIGLTNVVVNVSTYDEVEVECTVYNSLSNEIKILASSFNEAGGAAIESIGVPSGSDLTDIESLTLTSLDNSITITGDNLTKTIDFSASGSNLTYDPTTPSDWSPAPTTVGDGLDQLADRVTTVEGILPDKIDVIEKGAANGVAPLNSLTKIDSIYLPSYVDDVVEYPNLAAFPAIGESDKIYVALDTNKIYRWSGSIYVVISPSEVNSVNTKTGFVVLDKTDIGLGNVDNTSDLDKPISNDTQDALDLKVDKAGDTMTGAISMQYFGNTTNISLFGIDTTGNLTLRSNDNTSTHSGDVVIQTGDATGSDYAGSIYLNGGNNVNGNPANIELTAGQSSGTGANGSIILDSKNVVYLNQNASGSIDASSHQIQNVADPTSAQDAATRKWVEDISAITNTLVVDASASLSGADGSLFRPFVTIADALDAAVNSTVIVVLPGTYNEAKVVIPSSLSTIAILGQSSSSTIITNGFSYTATENNIEIAFEKLNIGELTFDGGTISSGLVNIKQCVLTFDRIDNSNNVFMTVSESQVAGGSVAGGATNLSECLILVGIDVYDNLFIVENTKFVDTITAYGTATIRILDCELFGGTPSFVFGNIVLGNTPTVQIDVASDYLGSLNGDVNKVLLASIPLSSITDSGANTDQYVKFDGANWVPSDIDASIVTYTPAVSGDWSVEPAITSDALDELAARTTSLEGEIVTTYDIFTDTQEPTGFLNRVDSVMSFDNGSRTFTIQPAVTAFEIYLKGVKYTKTAAENYTIPNTDGNHYIYYNAAGNLASTTIFTSDIIQQYAFVAIVYWNTETNSHVYFAEERHGITMDGASHAYLHTVFGARYLSGLALQGFTVDGAGSSDVDAQFTSDSGTIRDEDILHVLPAQSQIPVYYRQGQLWRRKEPDNFPFVYSGTAGYTGASGRIPYNQYTGGAWQLTQIANNAFILVHYFGTNDLDDHVIAVQGTGTYGNVTAARLAAATEITALSGLPFAEFVPIGSVVLESANAFSNTPQAIVRSVNGGDYVDFRGTQLYTPAGEATTHGLLSGLANDDHPQYHNDARGDIRYYTKTEIDSTVSGLQTDINSRALDTDVIKKNGSVAFTADQSLGGFKITNLANPSALTDAVNLQTLNAALGSSGDITEKTFSLSSNQSVAANVTDFVFPNASVRSFTALVSVYIDATSKLYETFEIRGIQKTSDWFISISSEGDASNIVFTITSAGQIQYTSTSYSGFVSGTMKFRAITTSV